MSATAGSSFGLTTVETLVSQGYSVEVSFLRPLAVVGSYLRKGLVVIDFTSTTVAAPAEFVYVSRSSKTIPQDWPKGFLPVKIHWKLWEYLVPIFEDSKWDSALNSCRFWDTVEKMEAEIRAVLVTEGVMFP